MLITAEVKTSLIMNHSKCENISEVFFFISWLSPAEKNWATPEEEKTDLGHPPKKNARKSLEDVVALCKLGFEKVCAWYTLRNTLLEPCMLWIFCVYGMHQNTVSCQVA